MEDLRRPGDEPADEPVEDVSSEPDTKPLTMKGSFGTAVGAAMLGFEQALRDGPPPEILAAEHMPQRGGAGDDGGLIIHIPDPPDGEDRSE